MTHIIALTHDAARSAEAGEDDLARAAAAGDDEAFGRLYGIYFVRVYRFLRTRTATPEDAADVTQQVFMKAYDSMRESGTRPGGFAPWLFRIARNAAIDGHRRRRSLVPWQHVPESLVPPSTARGPEESAIALERVERLRECLAALDRNKQELLALRFAAGLSSRQIAAAVGKSESAVKKQLTRTIQSLKEHYDDELPPQTG